MILSKIDDGVEETKTDPITKKIVHSADEFSQVKEVKTVNRVKVKKDGTVDKRSVKIDVKKDILMAEMALEIKRLKGDKSDKELKAQEKAQKKTDKDLVKLEKQQQKEQKRTERVNRKHAMEDILRESDGKGARITKVGKVDMRGRSTKCREHQQKIIGTMREALRKSYVDKAKKHIDEDEPDFEIVPVPKLEMIVERIENQIDYKALYEARLKDDKSDMEHEMLTAKLTGQKKRLQQKILQGVL